MQNKDLRDKILEFIKTRGPATTETMQRQFGATDEQVREAIAYWRSQARPEPIWLDHHQGYWWSAEVEAPLESNVEMSEQPPLGPADKPDSAIDRAAADRADAKWHRRWQGR